MGLDEFDIFNSQMVTWDNMCKKGQQPASEPSKENEPNEERETTNMQNIFNELENQDFTIYNLNKQAEQPAQPASEPRRLEDLLKEDLLNNEDFEQERGIVESVFDAKGKPAIDKFCLGVKYITECDGYDGKKLYKALNDGRFSELAVMSRNMLRVHALYKLSEVNKIDFNPDLWDILVSAIVSPFFGDDVMGEHRVYSKLVMRAIFVLNDIEQIVQFKINNYDDDIKQNVLAMGKTVEEACMKEQEL